MEWLLYLGGVIVYLRTTKARDRTGFIALWALIFVLAAIFVMSILGPPPPSAAAVAYAGLGTWLFVAWAYWVDKHRT